MNKTVRTLFFVALSSLTLLLTACTTAPASVTTTLATPIPTETATPKPTYVFGESKLSSRGQEAFILKNMETGVSVLQVNPLVSGDSVLTVTSVTDFFWSPDGITLVYMLYGEEVWTHDVTKQVLGSIGWTSINTGYIVSSLDQCSFYENVKLYCITSISTTTP